MLDLWNIPEHPGLPTLSLSSVSLLASCTRVMSLNWTTKPTKLLNHITCNSAVDNNSWTSVKIPAMARSQKYAQHHKSCCFKVPEIKAWIMLPEKQACFEGPQWLGGMCPSRGFIRTYHMPFSFPFWILNDKWLNNAVQLISKYENVKSFWETVIWLSVLRENHFLWYLEYSVFLSGFE